MYYKEIMAADLARREKKKAKKNGQGANTAPLSRISSVAGIDAAAEEILKAMSGGLQGPTVVSFEGGLVYSSASLIPTKENCINIVLRNGRVSRPKTISVRKTLPFAGRETALEELRKRLLK
jgi:hypothetical protein